MELLRTGSKLSYSCDVLKTKYIRLGTGKIAMEMKEMKINKSSYFRNTHNIYDTTSDISFNKRAKHQRQQVAKVI